MRKLEKISGVLDLALYSFALVDHLLKLSTLKSVMEAAYPNFIELIMKREKYFVETNNNNGIADDNNERGNDNIISLGLREAKQIETKNDRDKSNEVVTVILIIIVTMLLLCSVSLLAASCIAAPRHANS
uniref:Uncharacterized protein n=1 Tax=Parascaris equorum TaxID=6256 RepID=A0A914RPT4_PAREQ